MGNDIEIPWKKDCFVNDKTYDGISMVPRYADAGDGVTFNLVFSTSWTGFATGLLYFKEGYVKAKQYDRAVRELRIGTDYLKRAVISDKRIVGQVGNGAADHAVWSRLQDIKTPYPVYELTPTKPGSDVAGAMAAALASSALVYRHAGMHKEHATCVANAKVAYEFGKRYRGYYSDSIPDAAQFYKSTSYRDDLALAAIWLYRATGDRAYAREADLWFKEGVRTEGLMDRWKSGDWENQQYAAAVQLHRVFPKDGQYIKLLNKFSRAWLGFTDGVTKTPKGLAYLAEWAPIRHSANACLLMLTSPLVDKKKSVCFARSQANYVLGSTGRSFMVGYGKNFPKQPHHRAATCPVTGPCDWNTFNDVNKPNANVIVGAIVGGPDKNDVYVDKRTDYVKTEVAMDYDAPWTGVFAALLKYADVRC